MTCAEHDRLAGLLAAAPTSEAEDPALLASGVFAGGGGAGRGSVTAFAALPCLKHGCTDS